MKGVVEEIVYRNDENFYTVLILNVNKEKIPCVGKFPPVMDGEVLEVSGSFTKHSKYGEQFSVKSVKITPPTSKESILKYLSSGLIKGVGPVTALNIVTHFGEDALTVIEFNPSKLALVKGISKKKAESITQSFLEIKKMQNSILFLQQYGITTNLAVKIYNYYSDKTETIVKNNPYLLVEHIDGVGFFTADKIAQNMGIEKNSEFRLRAGILHILKENSDKSGNTLIEKATLLNETAQLLKYELDELQVDKLINKMALDNLIKNFMIDDKEVLMLAKLYKIEKVVAATLKLLDAYVTDRYNALDEDILHYEQTSKITLHEQQKNAVKTAVNSGISLICGGPGTGKTTIIKCITQIFKNMRKKISLLAPTGRAAKRLSESTNLEAKTIHRALVVSFNDSNMFFYNHLNKLQDDVIIVDEVSMVDAQLIYYLLRAVKRGARVILVGDKDQLPSVGAGNVLSDIMQSKVFNTTVLSHIYRQKENSLIIDNAHLINQGKMPKINNASEDFFFLQKENAEDILSDIVDLVTQRIPNHFKIDVSKIQVLSPMKAGICGIENINRALQSNINPPSISKAEVEKDNVIFREGDRVMQITNNYEREWKSQFDSGLGLFNGDIGFIKSININTQEVCVEFEDDKVATYLKTDLHELMLSYAITIHKSQGSEFDAVVIPIVNGPPMLMNKNLLYTAVTRAKKMVMIIGTKSSVFRMVKNNYTQLRATMLKNFLVDDNLLLGPNNLTEE